MIDYIELIAEFYPETICYSGGAEDDYSAIIWETTAIPQAELDTVYLTKYKTDKIVLFSEYARQDIEAGFKSNAIGYDHWYDAQPEDQLNLIGSVATVSTMPYACRPYTQAYQIVDCGGLATGTRATGLANDTTVYNAEIKVDGVSAYISVKGNEAQTYDALITAVNADIALTTTDAVASIVNGNIEFRHVNYGSAYTLEVIDASFGPAMTDFVAVQPIVLGTDGNTNGLKEYKIHTNAQLLQIINDGKDVKLFILQKFNVKQDQIIYCTDTTAVDAITWN